MNGLRKLDKSATGKLICGESSTAFQKPCCDAQYVDDLLSNHGKNGSKSGRSCLENAVRRIIDSKCSVSRHSQRLLVDLLTSSKKSHHTDDSYKKHLLTDLLSAEAFTNCVSDPLLRYLIEISSTSLLQLFVDSIQDLSDEHVVKILKFCIQNEQQEDENLSIDKQMLLRKVLKRDLFASNCQAGGGEIVKRLKCFSSREAADLLRTLNGFLTDLLLIRNGDCSDDFDAVDQILTLTMLLIDARSTRILAQVDDCATGGDLQDLQSVVTSSVCLYELFSRRRMLEVLKEKKKNNSRKRCLRDYSVEVLIL